MPDAAAEALSPGLVIWTETDGTPSPPPPCHPPCHPSPQLLLFPGHASAHHQSTHIIVVVAIASILGATAPPQP